MQIVYHIGANCTDEDRLLKSMLKNTEALAKMGTKIPGPSKYRRLIRETMQGLDGAKPPPETRAVILDAILDDAPTERLILSNPNFICIPNRVFEGGVFYALVEAKVKALRLLFPGDALEICIGLRNPATFVPAIFSKAPHGKIENYLRGMDMQDIRWSDIIKRIRHAVPDAKLVVWCNEDTPVLWANLIRRITGLSDEAKITGGFDLLASIMSSEGLNRFLSYMRTHPPKTEAQKRRIIGAFLDKYAIDEEIEEEIDLPGFTVEIVEAMTLAYDADMDLIAGMDGVEFIVA